MLILKEHKKLPHALLANTQFAPLGRVSLKYPTICFNPLQQRCIWNADQDGLSHYRTYSWCDKQAKEGIRGNRHVSLHFGTCLVSAYKVNVFWLPSPMHSLLPSQLTTTQVSIQRLTMKPGVSRSSYVSEEKLCLLFKPCWHSHGLSYEANWLFTAKQEYSIKKKSLLFFCFFVFF